MIQKSQQDPYHPLAGPLPTILGKTGRQISLKMRVFHWPCGWWKWRLVMGAQLTDLCSLLPLAVLHLPLLQITIYIEAKPCLYMCVCVYLSDWTEEHVNNENTCTSLETLITPILAFLFLNILLGIFLVSQDIFLKI